MAKVTLDNLLPVHVRTARSLLNMSAKQFAEYVGDPMTTDKIRAFENGRPTHRRTRTALLEAISSAGIELLNGGKPGVRVVDAVAFEAAEKSR